MTNIYANLAAVVDLARDLNDLENGTFDFSVLGSAPIIDEFRIAHRTIPCLAGQISNHPLLRDGKSSVTSQIFYMDPHKRAARTFSRWYRLGSLEYLK
ncbi:DUF6634 family protein [Neorhizobium sp. DAR64872/K0K18]|uniref:DUF6634 family protein n=1 Tax=Neorhizobium sp. DAR64872/K0K18 TaxID=3421958 RepID=UPI003D2B96DB